MTLMSYLISEVSFAAGNDTEQNVITLISRPMWRAWCRDLGMPEDSQPTEWKGAKETNRVYGSKTILVDSEDFWSYSVHKNKVNLKEIPVQYHYLMK